MSEREELEQRLIRLSISLNAPIKGELTAEKMRESERDCQKHKAIRRRLAELEATK
jgi:anti-sigma factor RsiW